MLGTKEELTQNLEIAASAEPKIAVSSPKLDAYCILLLAAASVFVFRGALVPHMTIDGADASLWVPRFVQQWTHHFFIPRWFPHFLAGFGQQFQFLSHGLILMLLAPAHKFHGFEFMLDTFLAGAFMFLFLRDRGLGRFGSVIGGLSYQLGNGLLTSARQGALWRLDTACWAPLFLLFFSRILAKEEKRLRNAFFAGIALGLQFLGGEVQLAYYVCMLTAAYFIMDAAQKLWAGRRNTVEEVAPLIRRAACGLFVVAIAIMFAAEVFVSYARFARENENVGAGTESDNWRFATEFSFPPEETLSLLFTSQIFSDSFRITPGGKVQRITDDYLGIVVLMFAALGLISDKKRRWFFAGAACMALFISFGRYFPPFYGLIYRLPLMSGLRNPHKWLFITSLCIPILAGMGADYWLNAPSSKTRKIVVATVAFMFVAVGAALFAPAEAPLASLLRPLGLLLTGSIILILFRFLRPKRLPLLPAALITILVAADLISNASKYLLYYNYNDRFGSGEVVSFLQSRPEPFRVKLWSEDPYLRFLMTEALPYEGIDVVDAIMSRRPPRYSDIFQALREQRLSLEKFLQLFNVRYVLSASAIETTDVRLSLLRQFKSDSCYLYEFMDYLPRAYLVDNFETADSGELIERMASPDVDFQQAVVLEEAAQVVAPERIQGGDFDWRVEDFSRSPHQVKMKVNTNRDGILVLLDFLDENWGVKVDGQEAELLRANYLMRGVALPKGRHLVEFSYSPPMWGFLLTAGMWIFLLALLIIMGISFIMKRARMGTKGEP